MDVCEVWIFNGSRSAFPSAVFQSKDAAVAWIKEDRLSGTLTQYPVDVPVYDWAIEHGYFKPRRPYQQSPDFIGTFSSASQNHLHFEDGQEE